MPMDFTERQRIQLSNEIMVQAPKNLSPSQLAVVRRDMDRRVKGLPGDVFMALDALRMHADQGNRVAREVFENECEKLGLTTTFFSFSKR
jgi:hypothetical protein